MTRTRWVYTGVGLAVVLVAGLLVWWPWTADADPCAAAITSTDRLPSAAALDEVAEPDEQGILTSRTAPFGEPRLAVANPESPRLAVGGTVVQTTNGLVGALDARTGERLWAFEQNGDGYGATQVGGGMVLIQHPEGSRATAVSVGIEDGQVRDCATFAEGEPAADTGTTVTVAARSVALLRRERAGDATAVLSLVDPTQGEPVWTREVELPPSVTFGSAAGDTIVFAAAGQEDPTGAWELATDQRDRVTPEDRRLYAFSADDGAPLWDHAYEDFAPQVVGTTGEDVVVRATRLGEAGDRFSNRLAVLDARTGAERWATGLPDSSATYYEQAALFGDVVVTSDSDPELGTFAHLTGRDLATGEQLWRIDNRITGLERAGLVGDLAMIPGRTGRGLELVNVRTGRSRTVFDGVSVLGASADGTSIGVEVVLGADPALVTYDRAD